jgi:hypothetical protein
MTTATGHPYAPIPAAFAAASGSTIASEPPLYAVHLQAGNKSRATVSLWTEAAKQLHALPHRSVAAASTCRGRLERAAGVKTGWRNGLSRAFSLRNTRNAPAQ